MCEPVYNEKGEIDHYEGCDDPTHPLSPYHSAADSSRGGDGTGNRNN